MLNPARLQAFSAYINNRRQAGMRGIIHITGAEHFCCSVAHRLLLETGWQQVTWLPQTRQQTSVTQYIQKMLGTEVDALVINAFQGFNPNVLGAASGCVRAGGALLLLTPTDWPAFADPDYRRMLSAKDDLAAIKGRFIRHVMDSLSGNHAVLRIDEVSCSFVVPELPPPEAFNPDISAQEDAIAAICRVAKGHARRPLVIQADRGRGKTAALGIAAARLLVEKPMDIVVTAAHAHAVQTLFRHAAASCNGEYVDTMLIRHNGGSLRFVAVDAVSAFNGNIDLLLVDEAAAIPAILLEVLLKRCKRVVFSTTVQGYEGNGRGFAIRFLPQLRQRMPQLRMLELTKPIRYADNDPLERFCNDALLLKPVPIAAGMAISPDFCEIDRAELLADKQRLQQLFGLLVAAHYQTTPDDLRILLDHPAIRIYIAEHARQVLAVALIMQEGGFSSEDCQRVATERRRYRGHLIPQTLAVSGFPDMLELHTQRILRIAVQPDFQGQGLGRQLLHHVVQHSDADFIGASFSADLPVLRFWQSAGMQVVRLGSHRESATGQYACVVMKPLHAGVICRYEAVRQAFSRNIVYQLLACQNDCLPGLAIALLQGIDYHHDDYDRQVVQAYLSQRCSFETAQPALYRFLLAAGKSLEMQNPAHLLLVQKLLLNRHWAQLSTSTACTGRTQAEQLVRAALISLSD